MVVSDDRRGCIQVQSFLDDLTWIDRCAVDGALEKLDVLDQSMLGVQEQHREHLALEAGQLGAKVVLDHIRRSEASTTLQLAIDGLARGF
ncbi:hypothetical protein D3C78_1279500 [compost metagenome]